MVLTLAVSLSLFRNMMAAEEEPRVAVLNERIETDDSTVIVEEVVLYPNESSIYGPGEENYDMPVKEMYGKGPVVLIRIEKEPGHPRDCPFENDWLKVDLFSDGRRLQQRYGGSRGSNRMVFGFSFWAEVDMSVAPDGAVELEQLGSLELQTTVSKIRKVFYLPLEDVPRGEKPFFEDEDVRIWEVKWDESWSEAHRVSRTYLLVRFDTKTASATFFLNFLGKDNSRLGASGTESGKAHVRSVPKGQLAAVEFWKIVPLAQRSISPIRRLH